MHETIRRARETVERLDGIEHVFAKRSQRDPFALDALERWQRSMPARPSRSFADIEKLRVRQWKNFIDGRIAAALARNDEIRREVTSRVIGQMRKEFAEEIRQLRAEITNQRSHGNQ